MKATDIAVVAFFDNGETREVLLNSQHRDQVFMMLLALFAPEKIPVSAETLPMEKVRDDIEPVNQENTSE